ncbi:hypothetical protein C0075_17930 [Rhizobium sp. KAs_5_22]|nr:hypothetical protein C0075_17930 [Rhizobium sp. KAs_5_22]
MRQQATAAGGIALALDYVPVLFHLLFMAVSIDTLGKAIRHHMFVVATCRRCERQARFLASDLGGVYGHGRDPRSLPFRCTVCDSRDCRVTLMEPPFDRTPETIVWRPVKIRG